VGKYTSRLKAIEQRIPRKQAGDTRIWLHMEDGTYRSQGETLTAAEYHERYKHDEVIRLWYPEGQQE